MFDKNYFLNKAQENFPEMYYRNIIPDIKEFNATTGDSVLIDLGKSEHIVDPDDFALYKKYLS